MIFNTRNIHLNDIDTCNICTLFPDLDVATVGGESREAHITIDSERTTAKVIDIRELIDNANNFVPFPVISFNCKKVPIDQACKEATEFVQGGNGNWAMADITTTNDKKTDNAHFKCALPNRKDRVLQTPC